MGILDAPGLTPTAAAKKYAAKLDAVQRAMPRDLAAVYQLSTETPTITVVAGERTTAITGGIYRLPKAVTNAGHQGTAVDIAGDPTFRFLGTPSLAYGTGFPFDRFVTTPLLTGGGGQAAYWWGRAVSQHRGRYLDIIARSAGGTLSYRLKINGRFLTENVQIVTGLTGSGHRLVIDFGTTADRLVEFEFGNNCGFGGFIIEPTASLTRPSRPQLSLMGFGDSLTAGAGTVTRGDTWPVRVAGMLGCDDWQNAAIGGSGAVQSPAFTSRIGDITSMAPDIVVIWGGQNELAAAAGTATTQTAYASFVTQVRTALPNALVFLVGMWASGTPDTNRMGYHAALKAAAVAANVPFVNTLDPTNVVSTAPAWATSTAYLQGDVVVYQGVVYVSVAEANSGSSFATGNFRATSWVQGTGKAGTLTGNGNADVVVSSDGTHPTPEGADMIERFLGNEIRSIIKSKLGASDLLPLTN